MASIDQLPIKAKALAKDEFMSTEYSMRVDSVEECYIIMRDSVEGEYCVPLTDVSPYKDNGNDILVEWRHNSLRNSVIEVWDHDGELYLMDFSTNVDGMPFLHHIIPGSHFHEYRIDYHHESPSRYCVMKYRQPSTTTRHRFGNNPPVYIYFYFVGDDCSDSEDSADDFF